MLKRYRYTIIALWVVLIAIMWMLVERSDKYHSRKDYDTKGTFPNLGLIYFLNSDPTVTGQSSPMYQLLWRTDMPSVYYKSGPNNTDWTLVGGGTTVINNNSTTVVNSTSNTTNGYAFGDGSDGTCNFDGSSTVLGLTPAGPSPIPVGDQTTKGSGSTANVMIYTLTRDIYCMNMTVSNGVAILMDGWRVYVRDTLTINNGGYLGSWGGSGVNGTSGTGGNAGTGRTSNMCGASGGGGTGGNTSTGVATNGVNSSFMPREFSGGTTAAGANAAGNGNGGGGGAGDGGAAGGTSGTGTLALTSDGSLHVPVQAQTCQAKVLTTRFSGGSGGGGGRGDQFAPTGGGGGGGAGGGTVVVQARALNCSSGTITAHGGHGGNGFQNGGGGGGGGGGWIAMQWAVGTSCLTDINGGTAGAVGGAGAPGTDGGNGSDGYVYTLGPP